MSMKRVKITLQGFLTYSAHRTFEIEVPRDENVQHLDTNAVITLADSAKVPWSFDEDGYVLAEGHSIDSVIEENEPPIAPSDL